MSFCLTSVSDGGYKTFAAAKVLIFFDICKYCFLFIEKIQFNTLERAPLEYIHDAKSD